MPRRGVPPDWKTTLAAIAGGAGGAALGGLIVRFAKSSKVLRQVVDTVRDWLTRNEAESVRMEIDGDILEITGATTEERRMLIESWVQRHAEP